MIETLQRMIRHYRETHDGAYPTRIVIATAQYRDLCSEFWTMASVPEHNMPKGGCKLMGVDIRPLEEV